MPSRHKKKSIFVIILLGFLLGEGLGRYYGLCDYPLYVEDAAYEYMHAPNQEHRIYRNHFSTNAWSMRSREIDPEVDTTVVVLIGDSVINGGNLTDQDSLASTLLENRLSQSANSNIRVLNISAGSWGPDNAAAYLKTHGLFNADAIILVCSSHDAFDNMTFTKVVGEHPQFPDRQVTFAWQKIGERGWQCLTNQFRKPAKTNTALPTAIPFNTGFEDLHQFAIGRGIPLIIYLHPTLGEFQQRKRLPMADSIIEFCSRENIQLIKGLGKKYRDEHYRDHIHLTEGGQRFLADQLFPVLLPLFLD